MKEELEALIAQEEMEKELIEEKINNFQEEEMKIVRRIKTSNEVAVDGQDSYPSTSPSKKNGSASKSNGYSQGSQRKK